MGINNVPFNEKVDDFFPGQGSFESDRSGITIVYDVGWDVLEEFLQGMMGYTVAVAGGLNRSLPASHPFLPWMYCTKITGFQPWQFSGAGPQVGINPGVGVPTFAQYNSVRLSCLFEPLTYAVESDYYIDNTVGGDEFYRYVTPTFHPRAEALTLDRGVATFSDTVDSAGNNIPANTAPPTVVQMRVAKMDILWKWWQIPEEALFGTKLNQIPPQMSLLGTVNQAEFHGYDVGTLLLNDMKLTPHNFPIQADFNSQQANRYYDVEFHVTYFEPAQPYNGNGGNFTYGWNSLPTANGAWANVKVKGKPIYPSADWTQLFSTQMFL